MSTPPKPTILISDDEPLLVAAISREVRRIGLTPISDTKSDVVSLAREHQPSVILLDVRQQVDGRDLLQRLKTDPTTRDLKVIVLSGVEDQFIRRVCLELGAEDYVIKPFDSSFLHKLARLCRPEDGSHAPHAA